jgi:serine/threonine-protein kinase
MSLQIGPYKIVSELGTGGMGIVYRALDTQILREVALKRLRSEFAASPAVMNRFRNEAKLQGRLNHPGIAQLYSLFQGDGATCIVMEFVDGARLKDLLPLPTDIAAFVMIQVLNALDYAHRLGVLHRDIKPENIIIDRTGCVKVMDFGIAHAIGSERMTREKSMVGTIEYMAPERILGREVTNRSDIYSLGILLFEMLSGRLPMDSIVEYELLNWQIENSPPPLRDYVDVPPELDLIIARAMEKDPLARYSSCEAMALDLACFVPDSAGASASLQQLVTAARNRGGEGSAADLQAIYRNVLSLLDAGDFASAERLLRQQAERYPGSESLAVDARFAASLVLSNGPSVPDRANLQQVRCGLFHALICERNDDAEGAQKILRHAQGQFPTSVLLQMAVAPGNVS